MNLPNDPDLDRQTLASVHLVSEYIFCPRAALNTYLESSEDEGREPGILRLDYQPSYELGELEQRLNSAASLLWQLAIAGAVLLVVGVGLGKAVHWSFYLGGILGSCFVWGMLIRELPGVFRLLSDHRAARRALAYEPNPQLPDDESVRWWDLRAAGFESKPCDELLAHEELGVQGRPWRVLRKGDLAIPTFVRIPRDDIMRQQRARIAAYCELIEKNEGARSPYGIILDSGTFAGTAIKPTPNDLDRVRRSVQRLQRMIADYLGHRRAPEPPDNSSVCRGCPHGAPRQVGRRSTVSLGTPIRDNRRRSPVNQRHYHSSCGDRFAWFPEHQRSQELNLC